MNGHPSPTSLTGTFRYATSDGFSAAQIAEVRRQNAGRFLVAALAREPSWWRRVQLVREATDPVGTAATLARDYARRTRSRPIAYLLLHAAAASTDRDARSRMYWTLTVAAFASDDAGRQSRYRLGESFAAGLARGADAIARGGSPSQSVQQAGGVDEDVRRVFELAGPLILCHEPPQLVAG